MDQLICASLKSKIEEQIERTDHLIAVLPEDALDWVPPIPGAWSAGLLLGHLLECLAGFCAVFYAVDPDRLGHFSLLRDLPVNRRCGKAVARERIQVYRARIEEGFALLRDADLGRRLPTVFVADGEPVLTLLLGNLEHLINHKHQLFTYLKLMSVDVCTQDLYRFRGASPRRDV
jgi:hypothetical protein